MIKKFWLSLLILFSISFVWITHANPIAIDFENLPKVCYKLKNVKIDDYKVIIEYGSRNPFHTIIWDRKREVYEAKENECTKCSSWWSSKVYLIDDSIDIKGITRENIDDEAILVWEIYNSDCATRYDRIETYKLINNWDGYKIESYRIKNLEKIRKFPLLWLFAIIIETIALFILIKSFQKKDEIQSEMWYISNEVANKKIILWWIIPTTVTLPLLWFILPLILWDWLLYIIVWEVLVTTLEAVMIKYWLNIPRKRAILASIVCNICSFVILLIYSLLDSELYSEWSFIIKQIIIGSFAVIIFELIMLFLVGKLSKELIPNKRLVLCWLITPIIDIMAIFFVTLIFENNLDISEWFEIIAIIVLKVLVDIFTIKTFRKIPWRKAIIASIFFNLCIVAIILALIYFFG